MSADKFMATLLSENSNEPVVHDCSDKDSAGGVLSLEGLVSAEIPKTSPFTTEKIIKEVPEKSVVQGSLSNGSNINEMSPAENGHSNDCIEETKSLIDNIVDSIAAQDLIEERPNDVNGTDIPLSKVTGTSCNGDLSSKTKVCSENECPPATQNYRDDSDSSEDDTSSTFSLGSSSDCSDSFLDKMHKNCTPNKIVNVKTKGELELDDLPPIEDLTITVKESEMQKIGTIYAIVDKLVIVRALKDLQPLDLDSVLFLSYENPLGRIFDVFGPVVEPFYSIRFNSKQHIADKCITNDADVFFAPDKTDITSYVFVDQLRKQKGSDASWQDNNEPPEEHLDYSDDEEEKKAKWKRKAKNRTRSVEDDDVQIIPHKVTHNTRGAQEPRALKDGLKQMNTPSQQYRTRPAPANPFFTPYSHSSSQGSSISSFSRPTMAAVMTSKYTPSSKNDTPQIPPNASQRFTQQQNFPASQPALYPTSPASFQYRSSVMVLPQTTVTQSPYIFQARPGSFAPNQMPPHSLHPMQSYAPRPQQQPYMVQPPASPAPVFQQHPVFGQVPSFNQVVMSPAPVQNRILGQQQVLSYGYPPYRPMNFVSQAQNFAGQAPNFGSQASHFASQAPPIFTSQAPTFTNPAVSSGNQDRRSMYHTPNFANQPQTFVNVGVPMLVDTRMGPQFQHVQSMTPPPTMRTAPLTVNIPTSPSPNAVHQFVQQSPGLLNVMPPPSGDFIHNRFQGTMQ